jgi:hypothetical protein
MRWVTRERPNLEGLGCAWLIKRFIDPEASIERVPGGQVAERARALGAEAFDIPDPRGRRSASLTSFEELAARVNGDDRALAHLGRIVRAASMLRFDDEPEVAGLHALGIGLAAANADDETLTRQGLMVFDALHAWATRHVAARGTAGEEAQGVDEVGISSKGSFPASDPPSFTSVTGPGSP